MLTLVTLVGFLRPVLIYSFLVTKIILKMFAFLRLESVQMGPRCLDDYLLTIDMDPFWNKKKLGKN